MAVLAVVMASAVMVMAQDGNGKFSMTTKMFLNELKQAEQPQAGPRKAPARTLPDGTRAPKVRRLIASPDTVGGVAYISCFIHLKNTSDLGKVQALGVEVEETFDGQDFVTARVPVEQLESLSAIDNVTNIKVARQMRPLTDAARQKTNTDDVLTKSTDAINAGLTTKFDGTGVVLGIIDTGIDFQHIAFKDKDGNSRIKKAYVYNGSSAQEYSTISSTAPTTDDENEDHGTHTASTAGGSSVKVSGSTVTVTDDHANATFGGMAPGADLYLAGINGLSDTYLTNALKKMVTYADGQGKPLVVSNSWGSGWGPRDGTGEFADLVGQYFGDSHPGHIILFASSNDAGHNYNNEAGGFFVKKTSATSSSPLGTIIRTDGYGGEYYTGLIAVAWASKSLACKLHVLDSSTGAIKKSWTVNGSTSNFSGIYNYYSDSPMVYVEQDNGKYSVTVTSNYGMQSYGNYTLAIEVYPTSGNTTVNMWAGDWTYFSNYLTTSGHTWTRGTDDMCVSDEATIPNAISVGAYVSKNKVKNYQGTNTTYYSGSVGDIAYFSSYATAEQSPTGQAYPWITAPGAQVVSGVNHYHTSGEYSYYYSGNKSELVVNSSTNPYGVMQGTSMATPVAAGIVALWMQAAKSVNKNLTVNDVKEIMEQTAINDSYTTTGANASHFGKGKIDALAGIQHILAGSIVPTITATPTSLGFADRYTEGLSKTATVNVTGTNLTGNIIVTLNDASGVFSIDQSSITKAAAENGADITVTWTPTGVGEATATLTLSSQDAENVVVTLNGIAIENLAPETLFYESMSGYQGNDGSTTISTSYQYLDSDNWATFNRVYPGSSNTAYAYGGSIKLGTASAKGSMQTGSIPLIGSGTLTFYLKKYSMDTGKLKVTVTGADADATQFEPQGTWTLCTVNLTNATGNVTITFETTSKRAYVDEIVLVSSGTTPPADIVLNNDGTGNAEVIEANVGKTVNVTLAGRTFYKDGNWNTICLPFSQTIEGSALDGADLRALDNASFADGILTLNFTAERAVKTIAPGTPYIIKWDNGGNITEPVFEGVEIDNSKNDFVSTDGNVRFLGTYELISFSEENRSVLFMEADNALSYSLPGARIGALRSYFILPEGSQVREFVLNIDEVDDPTAVKAMDDVQGAKHDVYNLAGQKIAEGKLPKGIYILNGKKVVK